MIDAFYLFFDKINYTFIDSIPSRISLLNARDCTMVLKIHDSTFYSYRFIINLTRYYFWMVNVVDVVNISMDEPLFPGLVEGEYCGPSSFILFHNKSNEAHFF